MSESGIYVRLRSFIHSRDGNIAILTGFLLPVLVGFCGLAVETSYWYYRHRDIQGAADVAAYGAAVVLRRGGNDTEVAAAAKADAAANGWRQAGGTITVHTPPTSGSYQNNASVEVLLTENQQRYFTRVFFGDTTIPISVRSTGTYLDAGPACFLGLNKQNQDTVQFWGNSGANFTSCNAVSNSLHPEGFRIGGAANITMDCAQSAGGSVVTASLTLTDTVNCPDNDIIDNAEPTPDPYADVADPPIPAGCTPEPGNAVAIISPGRYCDGLDLNGPLNKLLLPGVYVIEGDDLTFGANADITALGVTFFLRPGARLRVTGTPHLTLKAPTSGTYSGMLFFGDRTSPFDDNVLQGDANSTVTGAVYFPSQKVTVTGNFSGADGCMQLVADTIHYSGSGTFGVNCTNHGIAYIPTPRDVALVE